MVKQIIVLFIILASALFFKTVFIPAQVGLLMVFAANALMLLTIILSFIYDRGRYFPHDSGWTIGLVFLALFLGLYGAMWGHNQSFILSFWAQTSMYFYLFYFFLHVLRVKPDELERMIIIVGLIYVFIYFFQYIIYPRIFFGGRASEERGTVRLFIPGSSFAGFAYYLFLQRGFTSKQKIYFVLCLIILAVPLLQGTRSSILTVLLGTLIFIIMSKQVKSKLVVLFLMVASAALVFLVFQDIIMNLIEVSKTQASQEDDDIRVRSAKFFLYEFSPTPLNFWIGNGESHGAAAYGMKVYFYKVNFGFYQSDIGILGEYSKYGVLWVICVFLILRKFLVTRIAPRYAYIKYWAIISILNEILGGGFSRPTEIIVITSVLYIYDVSSFELRSAEKETKKELIKVI
jgi:hypothetical protein